MGAAFDVTFAFFGCTYVLAGFVGKQPLKLEVDYLTQSWGGVSFPFNERGWKTGRDMSASLFEFLGSCS